MNKINITLHKLVVVNQLWKQAVAVQMVNVVIVAFEAVADVQYLVPPGIGDAWADVLGQLPMLVDFCEEQD